MENVRVFSESQLHQTAGFRDLRRQQGSAVSGPPLTLSSSLALAPTFPSYPWGGFVSYIEQVEGMF